MNEATGLLSEPALRLGASTFTLGQALLAAGLLALFLLAGLAWALWRAARARTAAAEEAAERTRAAEARMAGILQAQAEMKGSMGALAEVFGARQAELTQSLGQRLDAMTGRIGQSLAEHRSIMQAIAARDPQAAGASMQAHFRNGLEAAA